MSGAGENALAVGLDLGTSGARAAAVDPAGRVAAMGHAGYGEAAEARRDPARWWAAACESLDAMLDALREAGADPAAITRIAVDGTSGSLVLTDAALAPVSRALMYDDSGFAAEAERIAAVAPEIHVAKGPASALARALRLIEEDSPGAAAHLLHQADFVAARLMGVGGRTDLNNALKTGIDPATGQWPDWIAAMPRLGALLPQAHAPGAPIAPLAAEIARRFGLSRGAMVHAGTTDSVAAFLACAPQEPGAAVTSLGTTLAIKQFSTRRIDAPELGLYAHRMRDGWLVGGASNTGGGVLRQFFTVERMEALSAEIDPAVESPLDYYPLPRPGERFPVNDPALQPRMTPRPESDAAFLHGLLEGVARVERRCYAVMAERGAPMPKRVLTAGGGGANAVWTAIRARVLGVPVERARDPDAAVGAARLAQSGARAPAG